MCGIAGFLDRSFNSDEAILRRMTDSMIHRGPDDSGYSVFNVLEGRVGLGQRRLSIIDLSPRGHQPMRFKNLTIVYNGEIYNYQEVRSELKQFGYTFQSDSDTEVILAAFHKWGPVSLNKFRGMWAFAIWNDKTKELFLCRDRMGVKPLYWYKHNGLVLFASELKAFHNHPGFIKELDDSAIGLYFKYSYIPAPHCIFKNAHKLQPGSWLIFKNNQEINEFEYWSPDRYFIEGHLEKDRWLKRPESEITDELETILTEGFKLRMVSDVPVGMFLSGGIDSSIVTALLQKEYSKPLKTFTIGFHEKKYNEAEWANKIAKHLGTDHTELYCTPKDAFSVIEKLSSIYDEPFGDSSAIPTFLVSQLARKSVTVALSADGGDEQFCGYPRYLKVNRVHSVPKVFRKSLSAFLNLVPPSSISQLYRLLNTGSSQWQNMEDKYSKMRDAIGKTNLEDQFNSLKSYFRDKELTSMNVKLVTKYATTIPEKLDTVTELMRIDLAYSLIDDMLAKVDRASMAVGLESREPFLDNKILEYSSKIPIELKYKNGKTKHILRNILYKYVPSNLVDRKKMGFEVPIHDWFKQDLKPLYKQYLDRGRIQRAGLFNADYINNLTQRYFDNQLIDAHKLWLLCNFEMWREKWLK